MPAMLTPSATSGGNSFERLESNVQSYARAFPRIFEKADGVTLWDSDGRRYLDFLAGAGALNFGHNNPVFKDALIDYIQSGAITHSLDLHTPAKEAFLSAMQDIIFKPRGMDYVIQFTGPTGTNAVEAALKIARKVNGRDTVLSFTNGFHGASIGALAVTGNAHMRGAAGVAMPGTARIPFDGYMGDNFDTIAYLERLLDDPSSGIDTPAAVILETVQGEGGLNTARTDWLQRLQALCNKRKIILIVDDIQAGCGRAGHFFSFEPAGLKPDIVTLSKSLSGYGLPFSVVLIKRELDQWQPGEHNGTFRGNNHAFVTATAMLEHYWRTPDFETALTAKTAQLSARLSAMVKAYSPAIIKKRGRGMMQGIEFADPAMAASVTGEAFQNGLIIERCGPRDEVIKCMMALTITPEELDEGLDILEHAVCKVVARKA